MRPHYLIAAFGIFVIGTMLMAIASGRWLISGEMNIFNAIASMNAISVQSGGGFDVAKSVGGVGGFLDGLTTMLTWDWPILSSPFCIFLKIPLWACSLGVIVGIVELGTNAVQGILGAIRNIAG